MNSEKTALRACPVCGKRQAEILAAMRYAVPEGFPLPAESDIVACLACGMVYADTSGTQADYDRYYADFANYENPDGAGSGMMGEDVRRLEENANWLAAHIGAKDARVTLCVLRHPVSRRGLASSSRRYPDPHYRAALCRKHQKQSGADQHEIAQPRLD
jgi:hypothetical protein